MNILLVHNSLNDSTSVSGVLKHYALVAKEWIEQGHSVDFLVATAGFPQVADLCPEAGRVSSDRWFDASAYIEQTWRYFPAYGWRMANAHFQRFSRRYDIVYASNFLIFEVYPAWVIARRHRARFVVKLQHVLHSQPKRDGLFDRLFLWSERVATRIANRHADLMMCLSNVVGRDYGKLEEELGLKKSNVTTVGCGLNFADVDATPKMEKAYQVVFLGRMHEQKGVFELPAVWQRVLKACPEATLLGIGEGPHRPELQRRFEQLGIAGSAKFVGGVPENEKNRLLAQSSIGLSLSYEEGWGLSVTEYLAAGLPVVAYDLPVFQSEFEGHLELVPRGDQATVADTIVRWIANPKERVRRGEDGRLFVRRFNYRAVANEEFALMSQLRPTESS